MELFEETVWLYTPGIFSACIFSKKNGSLKMDSCQKPSTEKIQKIFNSF